MDLINDANVRATVLWIYENYVFTGLIALVLVMILTSKRTRAFGYFVLIVLAVYFIRAYPVIVQLYNEGTIGLLV